MLPTIAVSFFGWHLIIATQFMLLLISAMISVCILKVAAHSKKEFCKILVVVLGVFVSSMLGGRLFHALWERPELLADPHALLTHWDGMVFYGAFFAGTACFAILNRLLFPPIMQSKLWDLAAIATALDYGLLRIGCFANGCCWGKLSSLPWSVRYHYTAGSTMPAIGLPVHPVQLYDSFAGFLIAGFLIYVYKRQWLAERNLLFALFCALYAVARYITENFRGDLIRRPDVFFGLSTSQILSIALLTYAAIKFFRKARQSQI